MKRQAFSGLFYTFVVKTGNKEIQKSLKYSSQDREDMAE